MVAGDSHRWQIVRVENDGATFQGRYRVSSRHIIVLFQDRAIAGAFLERLPPHTQACLMLKHLLATDSRAK